MEGPALAARGRGCPSGQEPGGVSAFPGRGWSHPPKQVGQYPGPEPGLSRSLARGPGAGGGVRGACHPLAVVADRSRMHAHPRHSATVPPTNMRPHACTHTLTTPSPRFSESVPRPTPLLLPPALTPLSLQVWGRHPWNGRPGNRYDNHWAPPRSPRLTRPGVCGGPQPHPALSGRASLQAPPRRSMSAPDIRFQAPSKEAMVCLEGRENNQALAVPTPSKASFL